MVCFDILDNLLIVNIADSWMEGLDHLSQLAGRFWDVTDAEFMAILFLRSSTSRFRQNFNLRRRRYFTSPKMHLERYEVLPTPGNSYSTSKILHRTRRLERIYVSWKTPTKEYKKNPW